MKHRLKMLLEVTFDCDVDDDVSIGDVVSGMYDEVFQVMIKQDNGAKFEGQVTDYHYVEFIENVKNL